MPQQRLPDWRGAHLFAAHQQALAHGAFQRLDAQRHRRQREAEGLRSCAKTAVLHDGGQCL